MIHSSLANSAFAFLSTGTSGSASFQTVRKSLYALRALSRATVFFEDSRT